MKSVWDVRRKQILWNNRGERAAFPEDSVKGVCRRQGLQGIDCLGGKRGVNVEPVDDIRENDGQIPGFHLDLPVFDSQQQMSAGNIDILHILVQMRWKKVIFLGEHFDLVVDFVVQRAHDFSLTLQYLTGF